MKRLAFLLLSAPLTSQAAITSLYNFMDGKAQPFTAQSTTDLWTFHNGDQNAALLPILQSDAYGIPGPSYATFGIPRDTAAPDIAGTAGTNEAPGIFVHTSSERAISAVYTFKSSMTVEAVRFTYELVLNGNLGNGIDFILQTERGGVLTSYPLISMLSTTTQQAVIPLGAGNDTFEPEDKIIGVFSNRGNVLYDHGWINIESVPEPGSAALGLLSCLCLLRRRR